VPEEERKDMKNDFVWMLRLVLNLEIVTARISRGCRGNEPRKVVFVCAFARLRVCADVSFWTSCFSKC